MKVPTARSFCLLNEKCWFCKDIMDHRYDIWGRPDPSLLSSWVVKNNYTQVEKLTCSMSQIRNCVSLADFLREVNKIWQNSQLSFVQKQKLASDLALACECFFLSDFPRCCHILVNWIKRGAIHLVNRVVFSESGFTVLDVSMCDAEMIEQDLYPHTKNVCIYDDDSDQYVILFTASDLCLNLANEWIPRSRYMSINSRSLMMGEY